MTAILRPRDRLAAGPRGCLGRRKRRLHKLLFEPLENRWLLTGLEIAVFDRALDIPDGATVDFGVIPWTECHGIEKTFTVRNLGNEALTVTIPSTMPAGFKLLSGGGYHSVPAKGEVMFEVRLNGNPLGTPSGTISIATKDADESPFGLNVKGTVTNNPDPNTVWILDDGESGFNAPNWTWDQSQGYQTDVHTIAASSGGGSQVASWEFQNVPNGYYRIWATWPAADNRPYNVTYTVFDGADPRGEHWANQRFAPGDLNDAGTMWAELGDADIMNGTLRVSINGQGNTGEVVAADAIRIQRISDLTSLSMYMLYGDDPRFTRQGTWTSDNNGYGGEPRYFAAGGSAGTATWTFNVSPGWYRVWTNWWPTSGAATVAPFSIYDDQTLRGTVNINQDDQPDDFPDDGITWESLGGPYEITSLSTHGLIVELAAAGANGQVIADAVRVDRVVPGPVVAAPEIEVWSGATNIPDGGTLDFGTTAPGDAVVKTLTIKNVGTQTLTLTSLTALPTGFSMTPSFEAGSLEPNGTASYEMQLQSSTAGNYEGTIALACNDADENPFELQLVGTVGAGELFDFGSAPDSYQTLDASGGPKHRLGGNLYLGALVDAEPDGQPNAHITGPLPQDEDGVLASSSFVAGAAAWVDVSVSASGKIDAWMDVNGNGQFEHPDEHLNGGVSIAVAAGTERLDFAIPPTAETGYSFARIRVSSNGGLLPGGSATDGEVEDYPVEILASGPSLFDFGDAPDSYRTLSANDGPRHQLGGNLYLGSKVDAEADGQPNESATGDDSNGVPNDEDGVQNTSSFTAGQPAWVDVSVSAPGMIDAWLDLDGNGQFDHPDEHLNDGESLAVAAGTKRLSFELPSDAAVGNTYARIRVSSSGGLLPGGSATDGEVEDYQVTILPGTEPDDRLQFSAATYRALESAGAVEITVTRTGTLQGGVKVDYQASDRSLAGAPNYVPAAGTLTFEENEATQTFWITLLDDGDADGDDTVDLRLSNPTGGAALGETDTAVLTVADDEGGPGTYTDSDGDIYTIKLSGPGTARIRLDDPDGDKRGPIESILLTGTTAKSSLSITVKKAATGDGRVPIGQITGDGDLKSLSAAKSDLTGAGLDIAGWVGQVTFSDVKNDGGISTEIRLGGNPTQSTKMTFGDVRDCERIETGATLGSLAARSIRGTSSLLAPAIGTLSTTAGPLEIDLLQVNGAVKSMSTKGGGASGTWTAASFGTIAVSGGDFTVDLEATAAAATLGKTLAVGKLTVSTGGASSTSTWKAASFGTIGISGGDFEVDLQAEGVVNSISVKDGEASGEWTADRFGTIAVSGGDLTVNLQATAAAATLGKTLAVGKLTVSTGGASGTWTAASFGTIGISGGDFAVDLQAESVVNSISVKGGEASGDWTAARFGTIAVSGGDFAVDLQATAAAAALGKTPAVNKLTVVGGDFTGRLHALGNVGTLQVSKDKAGLGGSLLNTQVVAGSFGTFALGVDLADSRILAGANLGADLELGGTGADTDSFGAGSIAKFTVGGRAQNSIVGAGLDPVDQVFRNGNDAIVGGIASKVGSFSITGEADDDCYFRAGIWPKSVKIGGLSVNPLTDFRFLDYSSVRILDDGDWRFVVTGSWKAGTKSGYQQDYRYSTAGSGADTATWTFHVSPGMYRVSATWPPAATNATDAPFTIWDGTDEMGAVTINQQLAPDGFSDAGTSWEDLGGPYAVFGDTLVVKLTDLANGTVIADAVRIEEVGEPPPTPEIQVFNGGAEIADGGQADFGTTTVGSPVDLLLTVLNSGTADLQLTPLDPATLPAGVSLVSNLDVTALPPGEQTSFALRLDAAAAGTVNATIALANNDLDEDPFDLWMTGSVLTTATGSIVVSPTSGLVTSENGTSANFSVVLASEPTADVVIGLSVSDASEGTVAPASLTFTAANWYQQQPVTVTGVNDMIDDGNVPYWVITGPAVSADPAYQGANAPDVSVTNLDNGDQAGFVITPLSGLLTTEAGGTAAFTVVLTSQPRGEVRLGIGSSDLSEGTVAPSMLVFTADNWQTPQTVTITGVDDAVMDGNVAYTILTGPAVSADGKYHGLNPPDPTVTNLDNDAAGIVVTTLPGLRTTEAGGTARFTVVLASQPTADVTIALSSSDLTEGTVAPGSLVFTPGDWNAVRTVTVTGVDDAFDDGDVDYSINIAAAGSADPNYNGLQPVPAVSLVNEDNDTAAVLLNPQANIPVREGGAAASVSVTLGSQPSGAVTVSLSVSPTNQATVASTSLTFGPGDWNQPQNVAVTAVDDADQDGDQPFTLTATVTASDDPGYAGLSAQAGGIAEDDDGPPPGIVVHPTSGQTTESADQLFTTFYVRLNSAPAGTATVRVPIQSHDATEGKIQVTGGLAVSTELVFTPQNWSLDQHVNVYGIDDNECDGDVTYAVTVGPAISADAAYHGLSGPSVSVTNQDDSQDCGPDVSRFNGGYTGAYSGDASGPVAFSVQDGSMTVTQPYGGSGTVAADGAVSFGVVSTETGSCTFSGTLQVSGGSSTGSGTWVCPNVPYYGSASGSWNAQRVSTLYVTGGPLVGPAVELMTAAEVEPLLAVATAHRAAVTASAVEPIEPVQLVVMDLPGGVLGMASSNTIYLDSTAAGYGWFVDRTPEQAEEFQCVPDARRLTAATDGPAAGRVDLITVLAHELGHMWGLDDLDPQAFPDDLMAATLAPGVRRVPWAAAVDAAFGGPG